MVGFSAIAAAVVPAIIGTAAKIGTSKLLGGGSKGSPSAAGGGGGGGINISSASEGTDITHQGVVSRPSGEIAVAKTADINPAWQMARDWDRNLRSD